MLKKKSAGFLFAVLFLGCAGPKAIPTDLDQLNTPAELGAASRRAYDQAHGDADKKDKLRHSHEGIAYAEKCLKSDPKDPTCLYFQALNTGIYIRNHIPNFQRGLKLMVSNCETLVQVQPDFEHAGCYRVLGNIYAQAPSFSLDPKHITQDLDKSAEYLNKAVQLSPEYPLNHLFLARTLEAMGDKAGAKQQLELFDQGSKDGLEQDYPGWKKERDALAQKLL